MTISSPVSDHIRHDKGVVIRYELHMQNNVFIVEIFRGQFRCSTCASGGCRHARLARQLEEQFQNSRPINLDLGTCLFCGRFAKIINGVAICPTCNS